MRTRTVGMVSTWLLAGLVGCGSIKVNPAADAETPEIDASDSPAVDANSSDASPNACAASCNTGICTLTKGSFQCDCTNTGFEGDLCQDNIDECSVGSADCSQYSSCVDTVGSVNCACDPGFSGDGVGREGCCRDDNPLTVAINTVFDPVTGLTWERDMELGDYNYAEANERCELLGFRLPTQVELESIVDTDFTPTWMPCSFREDTETSAWTSSRVGNNSAFVVHLVSAALATTF